MRSQGKDISASSVSVLSTILLTLLSPSGRSQWLMELFLDDKRLQSVERDISLFFLLEYYFAMFQLMIMCGSH